MELCLAFVLFFLKIVSGLAHKSGWCWFSLSFSMAATALSFSALLRHLTLMVLGAGLTGDLSHFLSILAPLGSGVPCLLLQKKLGDGGVCSSSSFLYPRFRGLKGLLFALFTLLFLSFLVSFLKHHITCHSCGLQGDPRLDITLIQWHFPIDTVPICHLIPSFIYWFVFSSKGRYAFVW